MGDNSSQKYRDEGWLREQYHELGKSTTEIAEEAGVHRSTISKWMGRNSIRARDNRESMVLAKTPDERLKDREFLYQRYRHDELSTPAIAEELNCSSATVGRWLEYHDIEKRDVDVARFKSHLSHESLTDADFLTREYIDEGKSIYQIAETLGCHGDTVRRWLNTHDIPIRNRGPQKRHSFDRDIRTTRQYRNIREKALERDEYQCADCGISDAKEELTVHHIVPVAIDDSKAMELDNLVSLCRECHADRHRVSEYDVVSWKVVLDAIPPTSKSRRTD